MLQFSLGKVLIRDRTKSVAEEINGAHEGDAAFANYVWMASYTLRIPGRRRVEESSQPGSGTPVRASAATTRPTSTAQGTHAFKPFSLRTLDGKKKTLRDFSNKLTLVNFFYPRCPFCNAELPEIQKIYDRYKETGLSVVWINILPEEENLIPGWQMAKNFTVPVLVGATQDSVLRDYRINATPSTYLLDQNGKVILHQDGYKPGDEKTLESQIETILKPAAAVGPASVPECEVRP
jgi:cytochrome oxidase Cu insertion factor (SCO1/SenC/PrrC family)